MQDDAGSVVEFVLGVGDFLVGDVGEVGAFGEVFADVAVEAFVSASLPW